MSRARRFALLTGVIWGLAIAAAPACAQNLDAGKPASQIFSEVCSNCHRSPREVRNNPSTSFLREHYTTGGDMASAMAAYLAASGNDARMPGGAQPKQKAAPTTPASTSTANREGPNREAPDTSRRPQQSEPKAAPTAAAPPKGKPQPATAEAKLPATPAAPPRPVLEDFEE